MNQTDVQIERVTRGDGVRWCVRLGNRTLLFDDESAARAFAAQLHMRLNGEKPSAVQAPDESPGA